MTTITEKEEKTSFVNKEGEVKAFETNDKIEWAS
jgi:hypothetical protein